VAGFTELASANGISTLWDQHYNPKGMSWSQTGATTILNGLPSGVDPMLWTWNDAIHVENNEVPANAKALLQSMYLPDPNGWIVGGAPLYAEIGYNGPNNPWGYRDCATYARVTLMLDKKETASNFLKATLQLTGNMSLAGLPTAVATLTLDRQKYDGGSVTLKLEYDNQSLSINGVKDSVSEDYSITVTNKTGVKLILNQQAGALSGSVMVGSQQVGTISGKGGIPFIRYYDGTFETF
jgi:hypothetical protein